VTSTPTRSNNSTSRGNGSQAALVITDPDVVVPVVAVHGAQVPWGKMVMDWCRWCQPGVCQACSVSSRRCWGPSGSPSWPIRPGSASTPPLDPCGMLRWLSIFLRSFSRCLVEM
jgi:hypothetical protein